MSDIMLLGILVLAFSIIIGLVANKKNFAIAVLLGSAVFSLTVLDKVPEILIDTATDYDVLSLIAIVVMIKILASVLLESGQIKELITSLQRFLSFKGILVATPSILGLLPIPGGALMSAPLIGEQCKSVGIKEDEMLFINLWFRHIWFLIFPLAPPIILLSELSSVNIYEIIMMHIPIFLIAFIIGYLYINYFVNNSQYKKNTCQDDSPLPLKQSLTGFLRGFFAILVTVTLTLALSPVFSTSTAFLFALPLGILIAFILAKNRDIEMVRKGISISLGAAIFGIMLLKNLIFESGLTEILSSYFSDAPLIITLTILSFLIGLLTAHNLVAIGVLFPIFSTFLVDDPNMIALLYISSFMGYLISPIHPCVVLSYDYFSPKFIKIYKHLFPPAIILVIISAALYGYIL